jgi:hypothetical protein
MAARLRIFAIAALAWAASWPGAAATSGPQERPNLSELEFAPSMPAGGPPDRTHAAQPRAPDTARAGRQVAALVDSIAAEQASEGPFSPGLTADLVSLASAYEDLGDHARSIAAAERARQVARVNNGLTSLDQAEMIQLQIASLEAMGEYRTAARNRTMLANLAHEAPEDLRTAGIYAAVADGRVASVERWLADKSKLPIIFGTPPSTTGEDVRRGLAAAQQNYVDALRATAIVGSPGGPDIYELERRLTHTFYLQATNRRLFFGTEITMARFRAIMDKIGASSYDRRVQYSRLFRRPAAEIAQDLVELGDWHLWFRADEAGLDAYRQARDELAREGAAAQDFDALFSTPSPLLIPAFEQQLLEADELGAYRGWFDVSLDLDAYGRSSGLRITARSGLPADPVSAAAIVKGLKRQVADTQFRPRFEGGERASREGVALRYYFKY